ncbi:glycosyl hydrolase family 8 [Acetivibrio mesophilus]|uniref:Glycoside hydrolase n=1 Tax=Acetivibrio mesophilus TaxID=2487273 RepID=A0A4Q0I4L7_9FIRM|nr:glycosyl hydrolase family 8 [Acetivibrio mesophilus]ODM27009.1 glycoside hydrolase [Clostridium sp. Bc-iso-3]RXE59244.1 glycoside hydrolase [Acetivibrio mesophilus]HHV29928.1 glycoside hydrolase [Clostridium sp.]
MKRFYSGITVIITFIFVLGGIIYSQRSGDVRPTAASSIFLDEVPQISKYEEKKRMLLKFIESYLLDSEGGVITNTHPKRGDSNTLSESIGILMEYAVIDNNKSMFDREYQYLGKNLITEDFFIKWRTGNDTFCNASIDDLRIIGALLEAYEKWGEDEYKDLALSLQQRIYNAQVKEGNLYEFFDWKYNIPKTSTPLCYLNLKVMNKLKEYNKGWKKVYDRSLSIIAGGEMETSPLFYKHFDYSLGKYLPDEEYRESGGICLVYTLYTALCMAEAGISNDELLSWLGSEMEKGKVYAWYDPNSKKPASDMESTAVYALGSIFAGLLGDEMLSEKLLDRMLEFMVTDEDSQYYGGFGNSETGEFYSFDNLMALRALALAK